jgi:hypothetical protein
MSENPFSNYNIDIPKIYQEDIKSFSRTGGTITNYELAPFERQIDFWYCAFMIAVKKNLAPVKGEDTYNATSASILSSNPSRITHIQAVFLSLHNDLSALADHRRVFEFALQMANAGIPHLIQILKDTEDRPIWNILDELESYSR